jgi:hypothetical protein
MKLEKERADERAKKAAEDKKKRDQANAEK